MLDYFRPWALPILAQASIAQESLLYGLKENIPKNMSRVLYILVHFQVHTFYSVTLLRCRYVKFQQHAAHLLVTHQTSRTQLYHSRRLRNHQFTILKSSQASATARESDGPPGEGEGQETLPRRLGSFRKQRLRWRHCSVQQSKWGSRS